MANNNSWKQPWVVYIIITSIIGITSFLVTVSFRTDANIKDIVEIKSCLDDRPTKNELKPELKAIKDDISEVKETQKEIYKLLLNLNVRAISNLKK